MVCRDALPGKVELAKFGLRHHHALLGRAGKPGGRLGGVALNPGAVQAKYGDVELGGEVALLGGLLEPSRCVIDAFWHALALCKQRADRKLRLGLARVGGFPIPQRRLDLAGRPAMTLGVHPRQAQHRRCVSGSRGEPKMGFGHDEVLRQPVTLQEVQGKLVAGPRVALISRLLKERGRARRVARRPLARIAHQGERGLGIPVALRCRFFIPGSSGWQIDLDPEAVRVDDAKAEVASGIALFGGGRVPAARRRVIDFAADPAGIDQGEV